MSRLRTLYAKGIRLGAMALCLWVAWSVPARDAEGENEMRMISDDALAVVTIMQEAAGEPYKGKVAVAEVIRNRMREKYASDGTVAGTVLRPYQFSGWNTKDPGRVRNIMIDDNDHVVQECINAWEQAKHGSNTIKGALLYYNPDPRLVPETPEWALPINADQVAEVGRHIFFVPIGKRGTGGASQV